MYSKLYSVTDNNSADRFIPCRRGANLEASYYLLTNTHSSPPEVRPARTSQYVNYAYLNWNKKMYQDRLWSIVAPTSHKVLNIPGRSHKRHHSANYPLWPVYGRKKPLIGPPSMVLDMPNLEGNICHHDTDWSSKDYLISVFGQEIYLWHPDTNDPYQITNTGAQIEHCVHWNRPSTHFASAMKGSSVAVWDCVKNQIAHSTTCICSVNCTVTSLKWTSTNQLLSGCSLGRLCLWSSELKLLKTLYRAHSGTIITIALSCDERYLATTATDCAVRIWLWPEIKEHFEIIYFSPIRGIAWHPWKDSIFAVGGSSGEGSISIWNASNLQQVGYKPPTSNEVCFIDNLTFNSLSGELVVSYWQQFDCFGNISNKNFILILSNLEKEVDAIEWHTGRVLYLLWGGSGTKLGTAGADETFCVWDFLGNSSKAIRFYKVHKKKKLSIDPFDNLTLFGKCIR